MNPDMIRRIDGVLDEVRDPESGLSAAQIGLVGRLSYSEAAKTLLVYTNPLRELPGSEQMLKYPAFYSLHKPIPGQPQLRHEITIDAKTDLDEKNGSGTWDACQIAELELTACGMAAAGAPNSFDIIIDQVDVIEQD